MGKNPLKLETSSTTSVADRVGIVIATVVRR